MVSGVAQVQVFGAAKYAVRVDVDPRQLAAHGIGIDEVATAIAERQRQPADRHALRPGPDLHRAGQRPAAARRGLRPDRSSPIATAPRCGSTKSRTSTTASRTTRRAAGTTASATIFLAIQKQPGTNIVAGRRRASRRCCRPSASSCPPSVHARRPQRPLGADPRVGARREVHAAAHGRASSSLVIFLFLRNVSATIIPSLALPVSIVGTFAVMYLLDYSLDNLSLMALTLVGRLRRRRRDRDAREHRPAHGDGQAADAGRASTARRRSPSRSSR